MCLAIPMRIASIDGYNARCEAKGIEREVSLFMLQDDPPRVGDFVMVQVGYALHTVSEADAMESWALYDQILAELDAPLSPS
jgi:hydrogenase expression/formation protein HypC